MRKCWLSPLTAWLTPAPRRSEAQPRPCCFRIGPLMLFSSPWFCTTFVGPRTIYEVRLVIKPGGKLPIRTASFETMDSYLASFLPEAARIEFLSPFDRVWKFGIC